jgi:pSer/pThr/pTyr-binding forkhead associated (FHA) protein
LIDIATHEEYEFIFSDAIGLGRAFAKEGYEDYLVINDPKVSKRHCSILVEVDSLYIQDEGSSNGTYVNNQRVNRPMMIQKEDVISIGNTDLEIFKVFRESH